jgi:AcrR family transcriptional regulator
VARVDEAHKQRQRQKILAAARTCFAHNGFHRTSMDDLLTEAGMSAGAFYRYYRGKDAVIAAIASEAVGRIASAVAGLGQEQFPPSLETSLRHVFAAVDRLARDDVAGLALQVWAETERDPVLAAVAREQFGRLRDQMSSLVERATGNPASESAEDMAAALFSLLPGYLVEQRVVGGLDPDRFVDGLLTMFRTPAQVDEQTGSRLK